MRERPAKLARLLAAGLVVLGCNERPATSIERAPIRDPAPPIELAPADDRRRSPYTGWTRAHYQAVFARMLLGFVDHRSPSGGRTRYPGGERLPAAMEGATRMLPALGAWLACACNPDRVSVDGRELDIVAIARAIVVAGTDPESPDYWGRNEGGWNQREVEAASVAEFLLRSRARVWDRLTTAEQDRIMAWLRPADHSLAANWLAFQIARNGALAALGRSVPESALQEQLDRLERDYVGDGFYRDGHQHQFDWYNAFVVHAESSFWRSVAGVDQAARVERLARRTQAFLGHMPYLFDAHGRIAPIGRSLAYRSAVLASLHASILAGDEFIDHGLARRISAGNLRFHVEAGMFDAEQVVTRGYHGEQPGVVENYVRPGSQYFVTHALTVLALPPEHPFWTAREQPLPADLGDFVHAIPAIGWTLSHDADGAGLILHNARSTAGRSSHYDGYGKLGYSPQTWYARSGERSRPYDAMITATAGRFSRRRSAPNAWAVAPGFAWLRYPIALEGKGRTPHFVTAATLADPAWVGPASVRLSCVAPGPREPVRAYEGSFAITLGAAPRSRGDQQGPWLYLDSGESPPEWGAGAVLLAGLFGWERVGRELDHPAAAKHALGGSAGYVGLGVDAPFSPMRCFASLQAIADQPFAPEPILAAAPQVAFVGTQATIDNWAGTRAWVELASEPTERTVELGDVRASGRLRLLWVGAREQGRRVVAIGVRELTDEHGLLLAADDPRSIVACDFGETQVRCELDGPARVRRPAGADQLRIGEAIWTGAEPRWRSITEIVVDGNELVAVPVERGDVGSVVVELD